jgi:hypothetical protein
MRPLNSTACWRLDRSTDVAPRTPRLTRRGRDDRRWRIKPSAFALRATADEPLNCAARRKPTGDRIERCTIQLFVVGVGYADGTTFCFQLGLHLRQLVCQLIRLIGGNEQILKDDASLSFELFAKYEIEDVVGHPKLPSFGMHCMVPLSRWFPKRSGAQCLSDRAKKTVCSDGRKIHSIRRNDYRARNYPVASVARKLRMRLTTFALQAPAGQL